jgi:putative hydrolase of the HAD superfamily
MHRPLFSLLCAPFFLSKALFLFVLLAYLYPMPAIKNIIFDLGGVIMNIDFKKTENAFADLGFADFKQHMTQFHITPFFEEYETGKINDRAFVKGIQQIAGKPIAEQEIIAAWNALLLDFPLERIELLERLKKHYRIFLLSNTNSLHYRAFQQTLHALTGKRLEDIFEKTYYSHTAHLRKPDAAFYQRVLDENNLNPPETLFIDDTASNLSGAEETGIQTFHLMAPMTILVMPLFQNL